MGNCCSDRRTSESDGLQLTQVGKEPRKKQDQRLRAWAATGVVGLRDGNLKACHALRAAFSPSLINSEPIDRSAAVQELPKGLDSIAPSVRNLDLANNKLSTCPPAIAAMAQLQRLVLSENSLASITIPLGGLTKLRVLVLDNNLLTELPADIGTCVQLEKLSLARNGVSRLPPTLGALTKLKTLTVSHNALDGLPPELGGCCSLVELDASGNRLAVIPPQLSTLAKLNTLNLSGNRLAAVPPAVLRDCTMLQTLLVHDNPITQEMMEATDGYAAFEARRQRKHTKTIAGGALINNSGLDTGVDIPLEVP